VSVALEALKVDHDQVFASDIDPKIRQVVQASYDIKTIYDDLTARDHSKAGSSDGCSAGFPCQAFSSMEKKPKAHWMIWFVAL